MKVETIYKSNKRPSKEAWVWIDRVLIKREAQALLI